VARTFLEKPATDLSAVIQAPENKHVPSRRWLSVPGFFKNSIRSALLCVLLLGGICVLRAALPQENSPQETAALDVVSRWKIANTIIFVIGLAYLLVKFAPAFFNARSADIQKAIQDSMGLKIEAEFRYSEIDRRMAGLADEVNQLRRQAAAEMEREHAAFRQDTEMEIERIRHSIAAEIDAFRKDELREIRRHTADVALQLAERRMRDRLASAEPRNFLDDFVRLVEQGKN
jgi:F-type H+-transporting ATPase subunit b